MSEVRTTAREFISELSREGTLTNPELERTIISHMKRHQILTGRDCATIREALIEMNQRDVGVYTTACIIVAAINSFC